MADSLERSPFTDIKFNADALLNLDRIEFDLVRREILRLRKFLILTGSSLESGTVEVVIKRQQNTRLSIRFIFDGQVNHDMADVNELEILENLIDNAHQKAIFRLLRESYNPEDSGVVSREDILSVIDVKSATRPDSIVDYSIMSLRRYLANMAAIYEIETVNRKKRGQEKYGWRLVKKV